MPKVIGIIPARLESTRLPGKLLLAETGKPLIVHTIEQAQKARNLDEVVVATDSMEIAAVCKGICPVFITQKTHDNGTSRCAEVAASMPGVKWFINIQADEPEINPEHIDILAEGALKSTGGILTLATKDEVPYYDPMINVVKVVTNSSGDAMYFSRAAIPHRDDAPSKNKILRHIGVYAYHRDALKDYAWLPVSPIETAENLEQLRFLWHEISINVLTIDDAAHGVNNENDYFAFVARQMSHPAE
jgi:3-deoxy-manno-octulosonate cytidylyltransferase (CMP-KDO synthetase)